jgi:hypothetical protein
MSPHRLTRALAGALAVTALAAPAAGARPADAVPGTAMPNLPAASQSQPEAPAPTVIRTIDDGFDWGSAALGGAAAAIVLLSLGGVRAGARARVRPAP